MEQLREMPERVEGIFSSLRSLREDLFDDNIGFIRKKIRQIAKNQSEGSPSNLNNYLTAVQRIADNCQSYWQRKGRTEEGYIHLQQQLSGLKDALVPVIAVHREQPEEIRAVISVVKAKLVLFLRTFVDHRQEESRDVRKPSVKSSPRKQSLPPSQKTSNHHKKIQQPSEKKKAHDPKRNNQPKLERKQTAMPGPITPLEKAFEQLEKERKKYGTHE